MSEKEKPDAIARRSEARLAAVKALYASEIENKSGKRPEAFKIILDILSYYDEPDAESYFDAKPDEKFLKKLVEGICGNLDNLDIIITRNLEDGWNKDRIGHVMLALLRAAVFELAMLDNIPFKVVINEYVTIARGFFTEKEVGFVNGILDKIAKEVR